MNAPPKEKNIALIFLPLQRDKFGIEFLTASNQSLRNLFFVDRVLVGGIFLSAYLLMMCNLGQILFQIVDMIQRLFQNWVSGNNALSFEVIWHPQIQISPKMSHHNMYSKIVSFMYAWLKKYYSNLLWIWNKWLHY